MSKIDWGMIVVVMVMLLAVAAFGGLIWGMLNQLAELANHQFFVK